MGILERLKSKAEPTKAVLYARFSSDNQRDESIDAQERAIKEFAHSNNILLVGEYTDRAKSATTDDRPGFQRMIADSSQHGFEIVLVHKLDRFARNRSDSIINRGKLRRNGVSLLSVTEPLDDTKPEAIILEAVLEAMAEYYSKNLAREVRKGLKENALKCQHTGGLPPLGYNVDKASRQLVINHEEAAAVKLIYQMVIEGFGYNDILVKLQEQGYKTKVGREFGKNSLYEILRNPKYKGIYVYNRVAEADPYSRTRNSHQLNDKEKMIIIPGGVPPIIDEADFDLVQRIMAQRRRHSQNSKNHREVYLLTGKIFCGECGCRYAGNRKNSVGKRGPNITYRCNNRARRTGKSCKNKEVNRDYLEAFVLRKIEAAIFNRKMASTIIDKFQAYIKEQQLEKNEALRRCAKAIAAIAVKQDNLSEVLADGTADRLERGILLQKIKKLELEKIGLQEKLEKEKAAMMVRIPDKKALESCFLKAQRLFRSRKLEEQQALINLYVEKIIVHKDQVEVILNLVSYVYRKAFTQMIYYMSRKELHEFYYQQ